MLSGSSPENNSSSNSRKSRDNNKKVVHNKSGDDDGVTPPTQTELDLVRTSWERVSQIRRAEDDIAISPSHAFGLAFYDALFEANPELRTLFSNIFQQARALTGMISYIARAPALSADKQSNKRVPTIRELNQLRREGQAEEESADPEWLVDKLRELGARHYFYSVKPEQLAYVGPAFVTALQVRLGDEYEPRLGDAWLSAHAYAAHHMRVGLESQLAWQTSTASHQRRHKANCILQ
ncbi:hypothetical protein BCR43DRAFT_487265 [Syncephalastrum racemosum]|uniref:Globin domain-containing protein n=1 Tax=Syncephalastrum racemosum TaxID=13706 RepID=A0A1X2HQJ6_SYNRA|nr:hypothetical protein BCR43DRAFT_487265 [Syncephalastrum racemosum]